MYFCVTSIKSSTAQFVSIPVNSGGFKGTLWFSVLSFVLGCLCFWPLAVEMDVVELNSVLCLFTQLCSEEVLSR